MGKGDKKSRRGKISIGSWGVLRPRRKKSTVTTPAAPKAKAEKAAKPKAPRKKKEAES